MAKKPAPLTLDDLRKASDIDSLPTIAPLIAEHERLTTERDALVQEVDAAFERMGRTTYVGNTPRTPPRNAEEFDRLTELVQTGRHRVERLGYQIAEIQQQITAERERLTADIEAIRQPALIDVVTRLTKALEKVAPIDQELRDLESLFNRFIPFHGTIKPRRTADELRQLARYVEQQVH